MWRENRLRAVEFRPPGPSYLSSFISQPSILPSPLWNHGTHRLSSLRVSARCTFWALMVSAWSALSSAT